MIRGHWDDSAEFRKHRRRPNLTERFDPEDGEGDEDDGFLLDEDEFYGEFPGEGSTSDMYEVDWWVRKPARKRRPGDLERRHSISHCSEYRGYQLLKLDHMQADVNLCGAYFELLEKHEDMDRVARLLENLLQSTHVTNEKLAEKVYQLRDAEDSISADKKHLTVNVLPATQLALKAVTKTGNSLDYRMNDLWGGTSRLKGTLQGYYKRTKRAMVTAAAEGANEVLEEDEVGDGQDGQKGTIALVVHEGELRQRRPTRIDPQ